jgi:hypothetical protein
MNILAGNRVSGLMPKGPFPKTIEGDSEMESDEGEGGNESFKMVKQSKMVAMRPSKFLFFMVLNE